MKSKIRTLLLAIMLASPLFLIAQPGISSNGVHIATVGPVVSGSNISVNFSFYHNAPNPMSYTVNWTCASCTPATNSGVFNIISIPAFSSYTIPSPINMTLTNIGGNTDFEITASTTPTTAPFSPTLSGSMTFFTLPVELIYFDSKTGKGHVSLSWATATEIENEVFQIERSTDGNKFETIGKVAGAGNSQVQLNYEFVDENPEKGLNYYRLKQMDFDGSFEYSDVVSVIYTEKGDGVNVYPNPSNQLAYLAFDEGMENPTEINIFDALGKLVKSINTTGQDLDGRVELDLSDLQRGSYMVNVQFGRETISTRLQKI